MLEIKQRLEKLISNAIGKPVILKDLPPDSEFGDFTLPCFTLGKSPEEIVSSIPESDEYVLEPVSGYLNIRLNWNTLAPDILDSAGKRKPRASGKIMIEFCQANTHKALHLGHIRNICIGESLARILEFLGYDVIRANYQGDVGPHVAKCLWGYLNLGLKEPENEKGKWLGEVYAKACETAPEEDVRRITAALYSGEKEITELWKKTREWSLKYFEKVYRELGVKFDKLYFESEVAKPGLEISRKLLESGIAKLSDGAIISDLGDLGVLVLVNRNGLPLYPAKELALWEIQAREADKCIHVVASEQKLYFRQITALWKKINPEIAEKHVHLPYEIVRLRTGKMSSRSGNVVVYDDVMESLTREVKKRTDDRETAKKISVAALKYAMLKPDINTQIIFDPSESLKLEGNTGPYVLYTFVRSASILRSAQPVSVEKIRLNEKETEIIKHLSRFEQTVLKSAESMKPHILVNYLYSLCVSFNRFYESLPVLKAEKGEKEKRIKIVEAVNRTIRTCLELLGIPVVERM
ncbi:MAG: arginine--tRNA ligase [Candidatus Micrarchaeota archaeon]|nr:arginine--tRNA ligase [Candidatus Micrarchaeota archaeon]